MYWQLYEYLHLLDLSVVTVIEGCKEVAVASAVVGTVEVAVIGNARIIDANGHTHGLCLWTIRKKNISSHLILY